MNILDVNYKHICDINSYGNDPDKYSSSLGEAHCLLWNKRSKSAWNFVRYRNNNLVGKINEINYVFTPDSIVNCFIDSGRMLHNNTQRDIVNEYRKNNEINKLLEDLNAIDYTIGSSIIFPIKINNQSLNWTMNRARGLSFNIQDRFDYTLECIRRYYVKSNDINPLSSAINKCHEFFDIFSSFKDYVDFFFLQDLVDETYSKVNGFTDYIDFNNPFPFGLKEFTNYVKQNIEFIKNRNIRIRNWFSKNT